MTVRSASQVIKKIGHEKLSLHRGQGGGYWYFCYDDYEAKKLYDTHSVYVCYLSQLTMEQWVTEGVDFIKKMESAE